MKRKSVNYVVAFLAVMMLPLMVSCGIMKKAEAKKKTILCINNLKQLSLGMVIFTDDNGGKLPEAKDWEAKVKEYVGSDEPFTCPACKQHYTYLGNGQKISDYDKKDGVIVLLCEGDHLGTMNAAFLDGHIESVNGANAEVLKAAIEAAKADGSLPKIK
ncbi:MAG: hypothetical protein K5787_01965 [Lentisphaeria bacterium]|nr:hypothetical protein [Victivallales bacterium]MCR4572510.1 hypothetical protein [Lentisphaeria bacterium]